MRVSLAQAAKDTGRSRSTILRTIRAGRLSAERDELTGAWSIDMSELARVFTVAADGGQGGHGHDHEDDQIRPGEVDTMTTRLAVTERALLTHRPRSPTYVTGLTRNAPIAGKLSTDWLRHKSGSLRS